MDQLVGREKSRQFGRADIAHLDAAILDDVRVGDLACRAADRDRDLIVAGEVLQLLDEVIPEELRPRDACRVSAGLVETSKGAGNMRAAQRARIIDPKLGISKDAFVAR